MPFEPDEQDMQDIPDMAGMSPENEPGMIVIPGFQMGGRVEETGIALVHEGEYIYPAPGSEARISSDLDGMRGGQVINYYFPIEVVVMGMLSDADMKYVAEYVYGELTTALNGQQALA